MLLKLQPKWWLTLEWGVAWKQLKDMAGHLHDALAATDLHMKKEHRRMRLENGSH